MSVFAMNSEKPRAEQDEELYRNTKKYKVVSAFRKAGIDNGETT